MQRFDHRTVIVTGGARGMGASHARGFVAEGANVVIADILEQEGRTLADELGEHAIFSRLDVTSDRDWAATVAAAEEAFGPVSVLVNNAGIVRFGPIAETAPATWRQVIDINLTGSYLGIRAVVSSMRKAGGGAIVNISSGAGFTATFGLAAYVASKWGVRGLTKAARLSSGATTSASTRFTPGLFARRSSPITSRTPRRWRRRWRGQGWGYRRFRASPSLTRSRAWCCSSPPTRPASRRARSSSPTAACC